MAVTGANFAVAETGTVVLVTNEGNGRFCTSMPRIQVAVMGIEKVVPRFADVATLLPVLTRSATGQALSNYVTMLTGPRRAGEVDGPEQLHVIFLDHNRRASSARRTRTCSPASGAARASTCARCTDVSVGTRTTRCTRGRWARC